MLDLTEIDSNIQRKQYASEATMVERAKKRAAETGRVTDPAAIRRSRLKSPQCVTNLAKKEHVGRYVFLHLSY
jgi:hypothetical protein